MSVPESTLITVFEMMINRIDELQDSVNKMNTYLITDARYKTNNVLSGKIFNYPFEIHNFNLDKKQYAYIHIKFNNNVMNLYNLWWSIFDNSYDISNLNIMQEKIRIILEELTIKYIGEKNRANIKKYIDDNEDNIAYITCSYYDIDTLFNNLPEFIINEYITKINNNKFFKSTYHQDYSMSINFISDIDLFIDEIIKKVLEYTDQYGHKHNDIEYIKIVGIDYHVHELLELYNARPENKIIQKNKLQEYIKNLTENEKRKLKNLLLTYSNYCPIVLPFYENVNDTVFLLDLLDAEDNTLLNNLILIFQNANEQNQND